MATHFHTTEDLVAAVADADFDRPPALVANAHITGLGVARALTAHDVPVIAVDRTGDGVAPPSSAVDVAGAVTYPLDDLDGFEDDVAAIANAVGGEVVAFGCMDEWVHAFADVDVSGVTLPFDNHAEVLNKRKLYERAEDLGVPYPETRFLDETNPEAVVEELGFPLVLKPFRKREGEEALGTNVLEVGTADEFEEVVQTAEAEEVDLLAQEKVPIATGKDCSFASYVSPDGPSLGVVGNATRFPQEFGTSCLVDTVERPEIRERATRVLEDAGYHGISESEFIYDSDREEYVLLDINTRPWKWIDLPTTAGANLPMAAYADVVREENYQSTGTRDARWIYLRDYLHLLTTDEAFWDVVSRDQWASMISGTFEENPSLTTAVYRPSDPDPTTHLVETEFSDREYYCSC
ncbi:MAG: carboxylate--amine ligase [Halanaeroarchaeum sp.]